MSIPYVIEGTGQQERVYDLYSRLLRDRIIFFGRDLDEELSNSVVAQLLFLEADNSEKDITIYINSRGGIVSGAMAIYDTISYIKPDVSTVCVGHASSAAAFILAAGKKGKRFALKNSRIMIHQVMGGYDGSMPEMEIYFKEMQVANDALLKELATMTNKNLKQLKQDIDRDYFMSAEEAKKYGIIDKVLVSRNG
jgi:ATP-dependent Clp protease protease subunit